MYILYLLLFLVKVVLSYTTFTVHARRYDQAVAEGEQIRVSGAGRVFEEVEQLRPMVEALETELMAQMTQQGRELADAALQGIASLLVPALGFTF